MTQGRIVSQVSNPDGLATRQGELSGKALAAWRAEEYLTLHWSAEGWYDGVMAVFDMFRLPIGEASRRMAPGL